MHEELDTYLTYDHQDTNDRLQKILNRKEFLDRKLLDNVFRSISRHMFIEETLLFPKLPEQYRDDLEYLERGHMEIMMLLNSAASSSDGMHAHAILEKLFRILVEHNSFEESFIYDTFCDMDSTEIDQITDAPRDWKCRFCP